MLRNLEKQSDISFVRHLMPPIVCRTKPIFGPPSVNIQAPSKMIAGSLDITVFFGATISTW
jgi:hypothetical protein